MRPLFDPKHAALWSLGVVLGALVGTTAASGSWTDNPQNAVSDGQEAHRPVVHSEILGVTVTVPLGATSEHLSQGERSRIRIRETSTPPKWVVTIRILQLPEASEDQPNRTPMDLARIFIEDARRVSTDLVVVSQELANLVGRPAARIAAEIPHLDTGKRARYDWLFVASGPDQFVLIEQVSPAGPAGVAATALKEILASLQLDDVRSREAIWRDRAKAGAEIVRRIDERILRKVLEAHGEERWYRRHAFDQDDNPIELGYAGVSAIETTRDQLGKANPRQETTGETGLLVRIRTRKLPQEEGKPTWDIDTQAWMSWDRQEEYFSTVATARSTVDGEAFSISHIGVRPRPTAGKPIRTLDVLQERADSYTRDQISLEVPDLGIFLSETERLILPYLLPLVGAPTGEFTLYAWHPERQEITRRLDTWTLEDGGGWSLATRSYPDAPISTAKIDPDGSVAGRIVESTSGSERWTRMTPDALSNHYRRVGVKVGL